MIKIPNNVEIYHQKRSGYEELANKVKEILFEILRIEKINYALIESRAKSIESFQTKLKNIEKGKELYDLSGIRVVGYVKSDVEKTIKIIQDNFVVDQKKSKDKASELKPNQFGYRAIHLICTLPNKRTVLPEYKKFKGMFFEIQVKTILEHAWAQIEHDRNYKYKGLPKDIQHDFYLVAGGLETADKQFEDISKRIEVYGKSIKQKTDQGKLDEILLNPMSIKQFLVNKFKLDIEPTFGFGGTGEKEMEELTYFDIQNIAQLNEIITPKLIKNIDTMKNEEGINLTFLILLILVNKYGEKYYDVGKKTRGFNRVDFEGILKQFQIEDIG